MIRHAKLLTASIRGLTLAMALPPLDRALIDPPGVMHGILARRAPAGVRAVDLVPVAVAARADVTAAAPTLDETVGVVVVHALGGTKG